MNLLEDHADGCIACEPLLSNRTPYRCLRGGLLRRLVLRDALLHDDGKVWSTKTYGPPARLDIPTQYWAVIATLRLDYWYWYGHYP
jgi:hypothetical protein